MKTTFNLLFLLPFTCFSQVVFSQDNIIFKKNEISVEAGLAITNGRDLSHEGINYTKKNR